MVNTTSTAGTPPGSTSVDGKGEKRKADDGSATHTRSKRNRYISIACNECKRRKIKCNGQTPCQRCGNLSLECVYAPNCCSNSLKDSHEFQQMRDHIAGLQDQVNELWTQLNELRNRQDQFPPQSESFYPPPDQSNRSMSLSVSRTLPPLVSPKRASQPALPQFRGPTSSTYGFDVAKSSLQTMGITHTLDEGLVSRERSRAASPTPVSIHPTKDPIWMVDQAEATRLVQVYEEECAIMYPIFDLDKVMKHISLLYTFIGASLRTGYAQPDLPGEDAINDEETTILKLILACALIIEGNGKSDLGQKLFDSAKFATDMIIVGPITIRSVILIVLTATYHFQRDEETQAWRFIGIAVRLCVEMGLHRKDSLLRSFTNEAEYNFALRVFWVVYALDRRWSFGTGMPFSLQDADIDPSLPEPDDTFPYLKHITTYNHIATKIWQHNSAFESGSQPRRDEIGFLDYQVLQWYQEIPDSLKFMNNDLAKENEVHNRGLRRLRFLMYLRKNQARISIYRPILHCATSISENRNHAETVVSIAKDTVNTITGVNRISDIYRTQQVCYNYFLVQALAAIFLAVAHAPATFCRSTHDEFFAAIDLIKGFSTKSHTTKRLWRTIRGLKDLGDKIGMLARNGNEQERDAHSNAAMTMAGLAGHKLDDYMYPLRNGGAELGYSPEDGQQMGNELTTLFEMAGAYGNNYGNASLAAEGLNGYEQVNGINDGTQADQDAFAATFGSEAEFSRIMNELF